MDLRGDIIFWAGIMRDHAMFQINAFTLEEKEYIRTSMGFKEFFENIMEQLEEGEELQAVIPKLSESLSTYIQYKKTILRGLLCRTLQMNLPPSLINHQINEAMEFKELLMAPEKARWCHLLCLQAV